MRLLLDEMYPPGLAVALREAGLDIATVGELGMAGRSDLDVLAAAIADDRVTLTENVADFPRICAERLSAGEHHPGVLIALSSRFSRRPVGIPHLTEAIQAVSSQPVENRVLYLPAPATS